MVLSEKLANVPLFLFVSVSVEPGVRLGLEGAHCQVLFAGGLHIWLSSDGCHGRLVRCLLRFCFVPFYCECVYVC